MDRIDAIKFGLSAAGMTACFMGAMLWLLFVN